MRFFPKPSPQHPYIGSETCSSGIHRFRAHVSALLFMSLCLAGVGAEVPDPGAPRWFKGNTHTHTLNSDGDSSPGEVTHWYRDHGYDFLVLSDHDYRTATEVLEQEFARESERLKKPPFLLIPGEEVSDRFVDPSTGRRHPIHVNGLGTSRTIGQQGGASVPEVLQNVVDAIHEAGGLPHVNHPNFHWALTADDLYSVEDLDHFEIFNGHPRTHDHGGGGRPSLEEMWDDLLTRGRVYYGVATDDAHVFKTWSSDVANPGRGWVMVRARELTATTILDALRAGDFYASTGVTLSDVVAGGGRLALVIGPSDSARPQESDGNAPRYTTWFIGAHGRVLARDDSPTPSYRLQPGDVYVRARVVSSNGRTAWTQPLFHDPQAGK